MAPLDLLSIAKFAAAVVEVVGLRSQLEVDLEVEEVGLLFELGLVLGTKPFDDLAVVEHPLHYCSEEG